jgi:membrane protein
MIVSRLPQIRNYRLETFVVLVGRAAAGWLADRAPSMGAALAYYMAFSLAPMLLLVIAVAGLAFGEAAAKGAIVAQLGEMMGQEGAMALEAMIKGASRKSAGIIATIVGSATLLLAATAVFGELQASFNVIWKVKPGRHKKLTGLLRARLVSLSLIVAIGFLLLVSLVLSTTLSAFGHYLDGVFRGLHTIVQVLHLTLSLGITTALFAMMYKILPDTRVAWEDVWHGALMTALLFTGGKYLISLYIGSSHVASTYGAAGAFVVVLLWIYYSAQIVLFGAEFARACAEHRQALRDAAASPAVAVAPPAAHPLHESGPLHERG